MKPHNIATGSQPYCLYFRWEKSGLSEAAKPPSKQALTVRKKKGRGWECRYYGHFKYITASRSDRLVALSPAMAHRPKNQRQIASAALALAGTLGAGLSVFANEAMARDRDAKLDEQAWACSTLYSRSPIKVLNGKERETALCLGEGKKGRQPMSRSEAYELCREQFDATSLLIRWTSKGWNCRYYGR